MTYSAVDTDNSMVLSVFFQEPFVNIPDEVIREALQVVLGNIFFFFFLSL